MHLTKYSFSMGELPTEVAWGAMVILPKPDGDVHGIGHVEAFWKLCSKIIDQRVQASVQFYDSLHGFWARRGTGTTIIEAKLFQQLAMADQVAVYEIFLDLSKAYDCVDRDRMLEILEGYGIGPRLLGLITAYWELQVFVCKQSGFFGDPFQAGRGVPQPGGYHVSHSV